MLGDRAADSQAWETMDRAMWAYRGSPVTALVFVEAGFVLGLLEVLLDRPTGPSNAARSTRRVRRGP